jgi:hypothetical protein
VSLVWFHCHSKVSLENNGQVAVSYVKANNCMAEYGEQRCGHDVTALLVGAGWLIPVD